MKLVVAATVVLAACGPGGRQDDGVDAPSTVDAPPVADVSRVYAHSGEMLYRMDPLTLGATPIGSMTGLDTQSLLDLAVDKNENLVGITRDKLFMLNSSTGAATLIKDLSTSAQGFTSLTYAPAANPSDPDILISANDQGDVFRLDVSGTQVTATKIGSYGTGAGGKVVSSGDLIGIRGLGIYATVDVGTGTMDSLAKIDPANGYKATVMPQSTNFDKIFGLGFWGGHIYGFVDNGFDVGGGKMIQIDPVSGAATELNSANVRWFGAGVTTTAPLIQ